MKSNLRNEIKSYIVRQGMTMQEAVDLLHDEHGWSDSVSNLSNKLQRESLRYVEAVQLGDALGYEVGKKKVYMTPSAAEVQGLVRADKHPKSTRYGRQNPISERWNSLYHGGRHGLT